MTSMRGNVFLVTTYHVAYKTSHIQVKMHVQWSIGMKTTFNYEAFKVPKQYSIWCVTFGELIHVCALIPGWTLISRMVHFIFTVPGPSILQPFILRPPLF